jgi:Asp-tRNA(Asn)/Glu-tRNA(Gln) amidotransferase A subunit family amidase
VVLSTVVGGPPPPLGYFDMNGDVATSTERVTEYLGVTPVHNATGTPAMSAPLHWTVDGLPVGVHFAGRYGEKHVAATRRPAGDGATLVRSCTDAVSLLTASLSRV